MPFVGLPVHVKHNRTPEPAWGRLADTAPWYAGGLIKGFNPDGTTSRCTSGFGVRDTAGTRYMLTAGHCGAEYSSWWSNEMNLSIGHAREKNTAMDVMRIPIIAGGFTYDGGVGVNEFTKDVVGAGNVHIGEWLCQSGAVSGAVCGFEISSLTYSYCSNKLGSWTCYADLVRAPQKDGIIGVRSGDSGGPVFNLSGPNVIAKGILHGMSNCPVADCSTGRQDAPVPGLGDDRQP